MPDCFECTSLAKKALYKYSSFPFLSPYVHTNNIHKTVIIAAAKSTRRKRTNKPAEVLRQRRHRGIIQRELSEIYQLHQTIGQPDSATYIPRLLPPLLPSLLVPLLPLLPSLLLPLLSLLSNHHTTTTVLRPVPGPPG